MNTSSAQTCCSTISISTLDTIDLSNITISNTGSGYSYSGTGNTITINPGISALSSAQISALGGSSYCTTIGTGASSSFNWSVKEEWLNCFPEWARIEDMCKQYPGLQVAFDKFKTTYLLVKNHYDTPEDERPIP